MHKQKIDNLENVYLSKVLDEVPRLLGLIDKDPLSPTYGCCDRDYWKYKIKDFSNARLQEVSYTLALLYNYNTEKQVNPYFKNKNIKELSLAVCSFWATLQHKNGSFDEYFFREKSHVGTVFSSLCIAETYVLLNIKNNKILAALKKAAKWISTHDDVVVINHDAGSIPFFHSMFLITNNDIYLKYLNNKLQKVRSNQNKEGWFKEYGGADIGYQSYSIYFLAKYYLQKKDVIVKEILTKAIRFFSYFISPDGTIGGLLGSRDTNFIVPAGFELLADKIDLAGEIALALRKLLHTKKIIGPYSFDNRFILQELYVYLDFLPNHMKSKRQLPKDKASFSLFFKNAGFFVSKKDVNGDSYYLIVNVKKSGVGSLSKNNLGLDSLLPYGCKMNSKHTAKNDLCMSYGNSSYQINEHKIIIQSHFHMFKSNTQTTFKLIVVKLFAFFWIANFLKFLIRKLLVYQNNKTHYSFKRVINLNDFSVKDVIDSRIRKKVLKTNYSPIYSTSVGFYLPK